MKKPITLLEMDGAKRLSFSSDYSSHLSTFAYLYLQPNGWFNDFPCDEEGIIPWYTFPAVQFLKDIVHNEQKVIEFGSGYSTLFFKDKVKHLVSIEHDKIWADKLLEQNTTLDIHIVKENDGVHPEALEVVDNYLNNFTQIHSDDYQHDLKHGLINNSFAGYASTIYQAPSQFYDMVVIDGMARSLCTVLTVESNRLKDEGIIILDNSDRWQYNPIQQYLNEKGYGRLDFWGPGWNSYNQWCTSFYSKKFYINNKKLFRPETDSYIFT